MPTGVQARKNCHPEAHPHGDMLATQVHGANTGPYSQFTSYFWSPGVPSQQARQRPVRASRYLAFAHPYADSLSYSLDTTPSTRDDSGCVHHPLPYSVPANGPSELPNIYDLMDPHLMTGLYREGRPLGCNRVNDGVEGA
jgi:hypothetical protein